MDLIMRAGLLQGLLCLAGLNGPAMCQENWKSRKNVHFQNSMNKGFDIKAREDLKYYGKELTNEPNFRAHLRTLLVPRAIGTNNHRIVREHIANTMENFGWEVENHSFGQSTLVGSKNFTNIIATLNPGAPRRMVIACHYDTLAKPEGFVGATDSAVPCAQMLNLAETMDRELKTFDERQQNPELTLQFIFFDGEEAFVKWTSTDSIYGSRRLAQDWEDKAYNHKGVGGNHNDRIDIFVLLDLIGASGMEFSMMERSTSDWYGRLVAIERNMKEQGIVQERQTLFKDEFLPAGIEDDHIHFKRRGVPILHLITYPFPRGWHKSGDNERSLDYGRIDSFNKILRVFVAEYLNLNP